MDNDNHLASFGSPSNPIVVQLGEYKGRRFLDIRRHYRDRTSKVLKPTRKGIALTAEHLGALKDLLSDCEAEIESWLAEEDPHGEESVQRAMAARTDALAKLALHVPDYHVAKEPHKGPFLMRVHSEGGTLTLELNASHPFIQLLDRLWGDAGAQTSTRSEEAVQHMPPAAVVLHLLLLTYARTKFRFDDIQDVRPTDLFSMFDYEWGMMLKNFVDEMSG
jgi:hypothetical protein